MLILLPSDPSTSTVYSDWVRACDPDALAAAETLVVELGKDFRPGMPPGRFVDGVRFRTLRLPETHEPWVWDMVGHWLSARADESTGWGSRCRKAASASYLRARTVERQRSLPVQADYQRENALLFARAGTLPAKEIVAQQQWLSTVGSAAEAHHQFVRLLVACAQGGVTLGPELRGRVRASAKAAGMGIEEDARVLTEVFSASSSAKVSDGLLDGAAKVFAQARPKSFTGLLNFFPATPTTNGAALLRMLDAAGAIDGMANGTLTPPRGLAGWVSWFNAMYRLRDITNGGITKQQLPAELFDVVERIGPRLRESGDSVAMSQGRKTYEHVDADLADALLAVGVSIGGADDLKLHFWGEKSRRDLRALAADPVLGTQLEDVVHADLQTTSTAIVRLPENPGIERAVHARIVTVIERIAGGGLLEAELALTELDELLDQPTVRALDGIADALAGLDGAAPLLRTLRSGIPDELCWSALENAIAEVGDVRGVTSTWPLLTVYGIDRAVAIAPHGRVAGTAFELPPNTLSHVVFYAGGDFLVGYTSGTVRTWPDTAFWASSPEETFSPGDNAGMTACRSEYGGALGYQFATPDGRHDGRRVLRPGDRHGVGACPRQMSDGLRVWSYLGYGEQRIHWSELDPTTGERGDTGRLPEFFTEVDVPANRNLAWSMLSYARLPKGVDASPLGSVAGMVGYRITQNRTGQPEYVLEGIDGRRAENAGARSSGKPWGVIGMPEGGGDLLMTYALPGAHALMRAHDGETAMWEVRSFPDGQNEIPQADPLHRPMFPPPAFWHFLTPRDAAGSRALRGMDMASTRALLTTGALPTELTDPVLARAVRALASRVARLVQDLEQICRRIKTIRSGVLVTPAASASDSELLPALFGLLDHHSHSDPTTQPATITALAAEGQFLAGEIDDTIRRMSPPAPPADWTPLLGYIDAVAWRAINARTPDVDRAALTALLLMWSAQPFAKPGAWQVGSGEMVTVVRDDAARVERLLDLLACNGARTIGEKAVLLLAERTGVRETVARLVLDGLPRLTYRGDGSVGINGDHAKVLRSNPYRATYEITLQYAELSRRLQAEGRRRLLTAGMADDPAELWTEEGELAAAERMAAVWNKLIGRQPYVPEEFTAELESTTGLDAEFALALRYPEHSMIATTDIRTTLEPNGYNGRLWAVSENSISRYDHPYRSLATALVWALTDRPAGDPNIRGLDELYNRLRMRLHAPDLLITLDLTKVAAEHFGPNTYGPAPQGRVVYDDELLVVEKTDSYTTPFLRPAALLDTDVFARTLRTCADHGLTELTRAIRAEEVLLSGLSRMVERTTTTPVAPGRYEADPRQSVPELVEQVTATIGVSEDSAALYLQLLALAHPTDRNVRRWNGWNAAHHKKIQAELVRLGPVVEDRRARAGRTAFIPGAWTEKVPKPHLPLETMKLPHHLIRITDSQILGPFHRILPPRPMHELFAEAWAARNIPETIRIGGRH
ncbi:hypothetical protein [Nocardia sp. NPDC051981]|uniref:hypothetical protein n=1 Tax=Nocardia sp. NPDC051981 TaxID=3155417 RepID=UPI003421910B